MLDLALLLAAFRLGVHEAETVVLELLLRLAAWWPGVHDLGLAGLGQAVPASCWHGVLALKALVQQVLQRGE